MTFVFRNVTSLKVHKGRQLLTSFCMWYIIKRLLQQGASSLRNFCVYNPPKYLHTLEDRYLAHTQWKKYEFVFPKKAPY